MKLALVFALVALLAAPAAAADGELDVYFHADLDGQLAVPTCGKAAPAPPDYAALLGALVPARAGAARPSIALLGPNTIAPDLYARQLFAADAARAAGAIAALLRPAGYAAFAIGSRDLSADPQWAAAFVDAMSRAGTPLVLSNVACTAAAPAARAAVCRAARPRLLIDVPGVGKVGVAATLSPRLGAGIEASRREGLTFADPLAALTREVAALRREGAARVLVLTEVPGDGAGLDELRVLQTALGELPAPPDALLSAGLADAAGARPVRFVSMDRGPAVVGSTTGARSVARLSLSADGAPPRASRLAADPAAPDAAAAATLAPWSRLYCQRYGQPLGPVARQPLTREAFAGYVLEVMRRAAGAEIAVVNAKLVKAAPFPIAGAVTAGELARAIPYRAVLGTAPVLGAQLGATLGAVLGNPRLRVAGLTNEGGLKVNGRPIDNARRYRVATIGFVAQGGDGIFAPGALAWRPLEGEPDVERLVRDFLVHEAGAHDGDPSIDPATDFGPPPAKRPLIVGLTDLGFDLLDTSVANGPQYTDAQLTRARQTSVKGDWTSLVQVRAPSAEVDARLRLQYGWARTMPAGKPAVSAETIDLITGSVTYNDRKLRHALAHAPGAAVPDPYARLMFESEFTRPPVTPTQLRDYHHAELTATAGLLFTPVPKLRVRGGPGVRKELVAPGAAGRWRSVVEAGLTLDQIVLASLGPLAVRFDGTFDYVLVEPAGQHQQQIRSTAHLSVPLLPLLFVTVGVDVYAAQYSPRAWAASTDTTVGLRVHLDRAKQTY